MTGRILTSDGEVLELPPLLRWNITYTAAVPCDSYSVTCAYRSEMAEVLHRAAGFLALDGGSVLLRGIVDGYAVELSGDGLTLTVEGRGYAARLLDNESRAVTYQSATLQEILRNHVAPYGLPCAETAELRADSVYTVASGSSQWKALDNFCRAFGGWSPRFTREGMLIAAPETDSGKKIFIGDETPLLSLTKRETRYGVLSEVLVMDKTKNVSYTVKNEEFIRRGGQCRRVLYTPGKSTYAAMRYTGEYQIARSREGESTVELCLPSVFSAFPGDLIRLELAKTDLAGDYRVDQAENSLSETGEAAVLTLRES